jgi:hypothetical protein
VKPVTTATQTATMKASLLVQLCVRLDGRDPLGENPDSIDDYREEYRQFWNRFSAWMRSENITPVMWPDEMDWWRVSFASAYRLDEIERVIIWLHEQGVEIENIYGNGGL